MFSFFIFFWTKSNRKSIQWLIDWLSIDRLNNDVTHSIQSSTCMSAFHQYLRWSWNFFGLSNFHFEWSLVIDERDWWTITIIVDVVVGGGWSIKDQSIITYYDCVLSFSEKYDIFKVSSSSSYHHFIWFGNFQENIVNLFGLTFKSINRYW